MRQREVRRASVKSARQRAENRASAILSLARIVALASAESALARFVGTPARFSRRRELAARWREFHAGAIRFAPARRDTPARIKTRWAAFEYIRETRLVTTHTAPTNQGTRMARVLDTRQQHGARDG